MTTILVAVGGAWILGSLVFCLALALAAAKPLPQVEGLEEAAADMDLGAASVRPAEADGLFPAFAVGAHASRCA
jgi:hypothetical protein